MCIVVFVQRKRVRIAPGVRIHRPKPAGVRVEINPHALFDGFWCGYRVGQGRIIQGKADQSGVKPEANRPQEFGSPVHAPSVIRVRCSGKDFAVAIGKKDTENPSPGLGLR